MNLVERIKEHTRRTIVIDRMKWRRYEFYKISEQRFMLGEDTDTIMYRISTNRVAEYLHKTYGETMQEKYKMRIRLEEKEKEEILRKYRTICATRQKKWTQKMKEY